MDMLGLTAGSAADSAQDIWRSMLENDGELPGGQG